jgi:hypothetical protein
VRSVIFFQLDFSLRQEELFFLFDLGRSTQEGGAPMRLAFLFFQFPFRRTRSKPIVEHCVEFIL